jgi:hypothetical protein
MNGVKIVLFFLMVFSKTIFAQAENDTIFLNEIEVVKSPKFEDQTSKGHFKWLEKKVFKVYPIFSAFYKDYTQLVSELNDAKSKKERRKIINKKEKELSEKYRSTIIGMTQTEGRLFSKFMHRYTGKTSYSILKELKGSFYAYFLNFQTKIVSVDLKVGFEPKAKREDAYADTILKKAFLDGTLIDVKEEIK